MSAARRCSMELCADDASAMVSIEAGGSFRMIDVPVCGFHAEGLGLVRHVRIEANGELIVRLEVAR